MGELSDITVQANRRIWEFVHERKNARLRSGTGWYSTPFRGGLFGETKSADVAQLLGRRRVDALWLGANPAVRQSLENILSSGSVAGDLPTFKAQKESGLFGSSRWTKDGPEPDWNPIEAPTGGWRVYRDLLKGLVQLDQVAMANLIPWGSQDTRIFLERLDARAPDLLRRLLEFADDLNANIVENLNPRLVFVPLSLARNRTLDAIRATGISLSRASAVVQREVSLAEGPFRSYTGICRRGSVAVATVFLRHPASLRLSVPSKARLITEVGTIIADFRERGA